jgi:hypothetical protein
MTTCNQLIWRVGDAEGRCHKSKNHGGMCVSLALKPDNTPRYNLEDRDIHEILKGYATDLEVALCNEILQLRHLNREQGKALARFINAKP